MRNSTKKMAFIAIFAAVNFVVFTYGKIDIPIGGGDMIAIHVANAVIVVSALLLGPIEGALAGAIGLSIADIFDPRYIIYAPMTFILKFMIGFIAGLVAKKIKLSSKKTQKEIINGAILSSSVALVFNVIAYPLMRFFYFNYILRVGSKASLIFSAMISGVTLVNAALCIVVATLLYALLKKSFSSIYR